MNRYLRVIRDSSLTRLLVVALIVVAGLLYFSRAYGAQLPNRSLQISDATSSATATYKFSFDLPNSETLGSIELQICADDPMIGDPCTVPPGFNMSSAVLNNQSGETGFTILGSGSNSNTIVLSRSPNTANAGTLTYTFTGVVNPSGSGTFYGRIQTFSSIDASGTYTDYGGLAFSINSVINISTYVPPYLLFCAGITISGLDCSTAAGNYINFGIISSLAASNAQTQMVTATNADTGFALSVNGSTMTSGNNVINPLSANDVSRPGVSQFGINLVANSTPSVGANHTGPGIATPTANYGVPNFHRFVPGDTIISSPLPSDYEKFTTSYIVNRPANQAPGVYVTTLTYVSLANF